jgi:hypothetical protein
MSHKDKVGNSGFGVSKQGYPANGKASGTSGGQARPKINSSNPGKLL